MDFHGKVELGYSCEFVERTLEESFLIVGYISLMGRVEEDIA